MGKYMRKAKLTEEITVMEISHQSSLGVRTRARTLALQRLQKPASPASPPSPVAEPGAGSYLQLRNRRLEKPLPAAAAAAAASSRPKDSPKSGTTLVAASHVVKNPKPRLAACSANSGSVSAAESCSKKGGRGEEEPASKASQGSDGVEVSFGENFLELEARDGNVRETTPCSLMRDSETTGTPGSTTRPRTTSNRRPQSITRGKIPTTDEMEEFFAVAEQLQQRMFTQKYNFDPVSDCPLPGRFEWVRLDC